ncbi:MAG: hypothetical protein IJ680_08260 [Paludibacteraceae bacterium]|nr:hypothetical protein [Paludibacteraceae bacterium]
MRKTRAKPGAEGSRQGIAGSGDGAHLYAESSADGLGEAAAFRASRV